MKTLFIKTFALLVFLLYSSCKDKSIDPREVPQISFYATSSKCLDHGLQKGSFLDSVFTYSFTDNLIMDFSTLANCYPDSARFNVLQAISHDTIFVSVIDTVRDMANCVCPYMIHVEYAGLPADSYVVLCKFFNPDVCSECVGEIDHLVTVTRTK